MINSLYASYSAYRHEDRGWNVSVVCVEDSSPGVTVGIILNQLKKHTRQKYEKLIEKQKEMNFKKELENTDFSK